MTKRKIDTLLTVNADLPRFKICRVATELLSESESLACDEMIKEQQYRQKELSLHQYHPNFYSTAKREEFEKKCMMCLEPYSFENPETSSWTTGCAACFNCSFEYSRIAKQCFDDQKHECISVPNNILMNGPATIKQACQAGSLDVLQQLVLQRVRFHLRRIIDWACKYDQLSVVQWALAQGADTVQKQEAMRYFNQKDSSQAYLYGFDVNISETLRTACYYGRLSICEWLYAQGADIVYQSNSPMHSASRGGHLQIIQWLTSHGANVIDIEVFNIACYFGYVHIMRWMVSQGIQLDSEQLRHALRLSKDHYLVMLYLLSLGANFHDIWPCRQNILRRIYVLLGSYQQSGSDSSIRRWFSHELSEHHIIPLIFNFLD